VVPEYPVMQMRQTVPLLQVLHLGLKSVQGVQVLLLL
jgi:hypothetical protein